MKNNFHFTSLFFATFSRYEKGMRLPTNGMIDPILSYFLPKVDSLLLLDLPHLVSDTIEPFVEEYKRSLRIKRFRISKYIFYPIYLLCKIPSKKETRIPYKLRDFFSVLWLGLRQQKTFDLFIGLESINALAGLVLKKFGKVNTVVYYVSDYAPVRFSDRFFNAMYLWLDRFCVTHADFTWDVSPAMQQGRIKAGLPTNKKYRVIHVPNGLFPQQIAPLPMSERKMHTLVYMGIMQPDMGPDLAIRAFEKVQQKYKDATLYLIGGSPNDLAPYKKIVKQLHIEKSVIFYGFVPDNIKMADIVRHAYIGLAPYRAFPDSLRWYGDAGKIRQYTAAGLPVVTTNVPPLGHYIVEHGAGIMTDDSVKNFSNAILRLFKDPMLYKTLSNNAVRVSKNNTWENVYTKTIAQML